MLSGYAENLVGIGDRVKQNKNDFKRTHRKIKSIQSIYSYPRLLFEFFESGHQQSVAQIPPRGLPHTPGSAGGC